MVERVEILPAKLKRLAFGNYEFLRQGKIEHDEVWTAQCALARVTVAEWGLRQGVSGWIEPKRGAWVRNMRIAYDVGPEIVEVGVDRGRIGKHRREGEARIQRRNAAQTPSS